ncbi:unnamed protein product [Brassicogethes aeneus]|uniref:Uncharacterized protein n=1 Tax=Brassicogethes aeneus TaxID=1431903 RepID=A0A9P0FLP1_BRAAE|nr:unnamed protein product [Brassicogethes aeneus]
MFRAIVFIAILAFVGVCQAQVNFSPNWGKRASTPSNTVENENNCKESVETIMLIYKIIQNEAQKLIECEKF